MWKDYFKDIEQPDLWIDPEKFSSILGLIHQQLSVRSCVEVGPEEARSRAEREGLGSSCLTSESVANDGEGAVSEGRGC